VTFRIPGYDVQNDKVHQGLGLIQPPL